MPILFENRKRNPVNDVEFETLGRDNGCILRVLNQR
jgi:hypothetical protein